MTTEAETTGDESADVQEARRAIEEYLSRGPARTPRDGADTGRAAPAGGGIDRSIDDSAAALIAREAWDAVQDATPAPPHPEAGPAEKTRMSPERAERHRRAVAVARGLRELGYHLDETLLPGPDMAAG
ncbi:hypothetical protein [Streptomyces sp. NBC_00083]|uniref:hypothetical protein n=1 Tax=Streptomyces sp. NBC_00083 TaxID=2975647 RepID=UPI00225BAEE2|nr:hypothetical protein [Streptomyces sp. NBC_00083]MCX5384488.1 hypothetical protein [Streptomyces sp. NBC_00083]